MNPNPNPDLFLVEHEAYLNSPAGRKFMAFHEANPAVYRELVKLARELRKRGHKRGGIKMLWEVVRWRRMLETTNEHSGFKLCNNYHSRYARLIMDQEEDLVDFFDTKELKT